MQIGAVTATHFSYLKARQRFSWKQ